MSEYYQPSFDFDTAAASEPVYEGLNVPSVRSDGTVKWRQVWAPDEATRGVHKALLRHLYQQGIDMPHAFGAMPGISVRDNVSEHRDGRHFNMLDIRAAFPSVDLGRLATTLSGEYIDRIPGEVYDFLLDYYTVDGENGLILGPPSSPYLFNIYCKKLDEELGEFSAEHGITYTRWIDDLTFSSPEDGGPIGKRKRRHIREALQDYGFDIADHKSRVHSLDEGPVTITGISLYPSGFFRISPGLIDKVIAAYDEIEDKLDGVGPPPTLHDLGVVNGYNSVLTWTRDPQRSGLTQIERELQDRYYDIKHRLGALGIRSQKGSYTDYAPELETEWP